MKIHTMRRTYLREAIAMLLLARLAVRFIRPAHIFAWASRPPRRIRRFAADEASWVIWAIEEIDARPWMNARCLARAMAAHAMLRRRGIASRLCLGAARDGGNILAHAWVEIGDDKFVKGTEADGYTRLAAFGGTR
jgi:Transglutaminase-like superfamily